MENVLLAKSKNKLEKIVKKYNSCPMINPIPPKFKYNGLSAEKKFPCKIPAGNSIKNNLFFEKKS